MLISIIGCNNENNTSNDITETSNSAIVSDFLKDIKTLEKIEDKNQITLFQKTAETKAAKILTLTKENIKNVLVLAKEYEHFVITAGDHTIVKVVAIENCKQSGSWGACMPYAKGYIKKGNLTFKEDYINNIIGMPDAQIRKAYFFE